MKTKVSVIVPVCNVEKYLEDAITSVLHQTLEDFEIIAVDDGSTDRSGEILDKYAERDSRIHVIHKKNTGYGHTMNVGIDAAKGEYIAFLEADDQMNPNMLKDLYTVASSMKVEIVKADFVKFWDSPEGIKERMVRTALKPSMYYRVFNPKTAEPAFFLCAVMSWTGIYQRDFLERWNIRHNETPGAAYQDNGFWFQIMSRATKVTFIDSIGYRYRIDNPNSSVRQTGRIYSMNEEYAFIYSYIFTRPELHYMFPVYWYRKYENDRFTLRRIIKSARYNYVKHMEEEFRSAANRGSLNPAYFTKKYWDEVQLLLNDVDAYFEQYGNME